MANFLSNTLLNFAALKEALLQRIAMYRQAVKFKFHGFSVNNILKCRTNSHSEQSS